MAISKADWELMKKVAAYFEATKKAVDPKAKYKLKREDSRSVNDTAEHFNITRSKATKMLITMGVFSTPMSKEAQKLRQSGMSIKDIAAQLGVSVGTVSCNLPYEDEIHGSDTVSDHAAAMREYRAYERMQRERQVHAKQDKKEKNDESAERKGQNMSDDWRKDLDSKLSFTETDSRRPRVTYEMIEESGMFARAKAALEAGGIELLYRDDNREELRAKENLTPEEMLGLGEFPGALHDRNPYDLMELYGEDLPYEPREMIRLHLELQTDFTDEEKEIMHRYGAMEGETISRDILVSDDLPLYALHYVIQRAFGWQNSHLHRFYLPKESVEKLTESVEQWTYQVGVLYRSPLMDENAEFWADDYARGSFKNWLRKKYTGPCVSQCWDEGLIACREDMKRVDLDKEYYVAYGYYGNGEDREAMPLRCWQVSGWDGKRNDPPEADNYVHKFRVEAMKLRDLPVSLLSQIFERGAFDILERLPIGQVLALHNMTCEDESQEGDVVSTYQEMLDNGMDDEIDEILESGLDAPMKQPFVYSFTDALFYQYDFGDNWQIRITGSRNCVDLVERGKITQDMLDKSNIKARVTYRPVLLARDGEMLMDDVGGISGFVEFIKAINTMQRGERDENGMSRTELKDWATSQGWHKDNSTDFNLL